MAIKTFNIDAETYKAYSEYCKKSGISMSKKVEKFIQDELNKIKATIPGEFFGIKDSDKKTETIQETPKQEHSFKKYC